MKVIRWFLFMFLVSITGSTMVSGGLRGAMNPEVKELKGGFYWAQYPDFVYKVDTVARLCFAQAGPLTTVDCANLARRPEWAPIITWTNEK